MLAGSMVRELETLDSGDMAPNQPISDACTKECADLKVVAANWAALNSKDLTAFNAILAKFNVKPIAAAAAASASSVPASRN